MEDKVGDENPSDKQVEKWVANVKGLRDQLAPHTVSLGVEDIKHMLKPRPNGDSIVPLIVELVGRYKVVIPNISTEGMLADQALSLSLAPLDALLTELQKRVDHTRLEADSEKWFAVTAFYTALLGLSRHNPELQTAMKPLVEFFATGRRAAKATAAK